MANMLALLLCIFPHRLSISVSMEENLGGSPYCCLEQISEPDNLLNTGDYNAKIRSLAITRLPASANVLPLLIRLHPLRNYSIKIPFRRHGCQTNSKDILVSGFEFSVHVDMRIFGFVNIWFLGWTHCIHVQCLVGRMDWSSGGPWF